MKSLWAAAWVTGGEEELESLRVACRGLLASDGSLRVVLLHNAMEPLPPDVLQWGADASVLTVAVDAYPNATPRQQNADHADYPDTVLAPYASASLRLERVFEDWQRENGPPDGVLVSSSDGLPYFTFHRAWRDRTYLKDACLALLSRPRRAERAIFAGEPLYRHDHYWIGRMEAFCEGAASLVSRGDRFDPGPRRTGRDEMGHFPFSLRGTEAPISDGGNGCLTVIIPYYNMREWVGEAIESVLASDRVPEEILIIDDGSEETHAAALGALAARSERIRVVRQPNRGLGPTRIRGVEEATGEFVFFLDADDAVAPTFFTKAVQLLERFKNVTMVTAWEQYVGAVTKVWPKWDADLPWMLGKNMTTPMVMVRRAAWLRSVSWSSDFAKNYEDYDAWLSLLGAGGRMLCIPEVLLIHRIRPGSRWDCRTVEQVRRLKAALVKKHASLYREHALDLIGLLAANGPASGWDTPAAFHDHRGGRIVAAGAHP
jgi:GT2 family glycosyltransferase